MLANDDLLTIVLNPRYKTEYFRRQEWSPDRIRTAENLVREQWKKYYRPKPAPLPTAESQQSVSPKPISLLLRYLPVTLLALISSTAV